MDIADRLKMLMEEKRIGTGALAIKSDLTSDAIYKILKRERKNPSMATLRKLAAGLEVNVAELLAEDGESDKEVIGLCLTRSDRVLERQGVYHLSTPEQHPVEIDLPADLELRLLRAAARRRVPFHDLVIEFLEDALARANT
jgi:transcriptional regulator with XRE-family HTH domain